MSLPLRLALVVTLAALLLGGFAAPASALNPLKALCGVAKVVTAGRTDPCGTTERVGRVLKAGGKLLTGHPGGAVSALEGAPSAGSATVALGALVVWVLGGARYGLDETAKVLSATTTPQLRSTWFSGTYWRMAGIAAVLTLPFLFAAALQALVRGDLALLARAAFMHLPLAMVAVGIAAPLTMLVLAASDELSAIVSSAAGNQATHFLGHAALGIGLLTALSSPFLAFLIGAFTVTATLALWVELLVRQAAVYVIVLMLPLTFAAFVWPARRVWAVRTIELLFALILSKFAIVAVLSLGAAALNSSLASLSVARLLAGLVLVVMAAFMPWALLRLVPVAEVASGAAGALGHELRGLRHRSTVADRVASAGEEWVGSVTAHMRRQAREVEGADGSVAASTGASDPMSGTGGRTDGAAARPAEASARHNGHAPTGVAQEPPTAPTGVAQEPASAPAGASAGAPARPGGPSGDASSDGARPRRAPSNGDHASAACATPAAGDPALAGWRSSDADAGAADEYIDPAPVGGPPDEWESELLDAEPMSRTLSYGGVDADRRPRSPRVDGGRKGSDDPDPLPPVQDPAEGAL